MDFSDRLFDFNGRLRRRDWWLLSIGLGLFNYTIMQVVAPMVLGDDGRAQITPGSFIPTYPVPLLVLLLAMTAILLWPNLALAAKRAHDRDKSATLAMLLTVFCTLANCGSLIGMTVTHDLSLVMLSGLVNLTAGLYLLVTLGFLDGTPGANQYGDSPKGYAGPYAEFVDEPA